MSSPKLGSLPVRRLDRVEAGIAERTAFEGVDTGDRAAAGAAYLVFQQAGVLAALQLNLYFLL